MKLKISKTYILSVCLFISAFVDLRYFPNYNIVRDICIIISALIILPDFQKILSSEKVVYIGLGMFVLTIFISTFVNYGNAKPHLNTMLIFCATFIELFLGVTYISKRQRIKEMISCFFWMQLIVVFINDIMQIIKPVKVAPDTVYFIGDKFTVLYSHMILIALYLVRTEFVRTNPYIRKIVAITMIIWTFNFGIQLESGSTIICLLLFAIIVIVLRNGWNIAFKPSTVVATLFLSVLFVFCYNIVLGIPVVQRFIIEILGKTLTLSNRVKIYSLLPSVLSGRWILGYGFGTSYDVWVSILGYGNAQNGILDWICQCGIFSAFFIIFIILSSLKRLDNEKNKSVVAPILAIVYVLSLYAAVEITLELQYFSMIAIIYGMNLLDEKIKE